MYKLDTVDIDDSMSCMLSDTTLTVALCLLLISISIMLGFILGIAYKSHKPCAACGYVAQKTINGGTTE